MEKEAIKKRLTGRAKYRTTTKKNIKSCKEQDQIANKGRPITITSDFSMETLKARRAWTDVLQTLRAQRCQPKQPELAKL